MSSQLFVTWFDVASHQHLKKFFLAPWLLPWIYPWDLPCISYSLLVPWVLPCWHPWVLPCHLDTLGVQCTLNILVPLIYQQFRSDFIIAALTPLPSPTLLRCLLFCLPPPYNLSSKKFWSFERKKNNLKRTRRLLRWDIPYGTPFLNSSVKQALQRAYGHNKPLKKQ